MTTTTVNPEKLAQLDDLTLDHGSHPTFQAGHCAMEVVAWLADQGHTDAPPCASPVLARLTIRLNDRWSQEKRQQLKPFLPRMVGTGGDGKDPARERIAAEFLVERLLEPWLRLAGMDDEAAKLSNLSGSSGAERRALLRGISDAAWRLRGENIRRLRDQVREELTKRGLHGAAVAAVAADAAADAAVVAAVAAVADGDSWSVAYRAARKHFEENPLPISEEITQLAASQDGAALELLELLIDPAVQS